MPGERKIYVYDIMRNGSGYIDPTAYKAIKNLIKGEETMEMKRGEIFEYNMQNGERKYAIVISSDARKSDKILSMILLSDEPKGRISAAVVCKKQMYADCGMVSYGYSDRFGNYVRTATDDEMDNLEAGILEALGMDGLKYCPAQEEAALELVNELKMKLEGAERLLDEEKEKFNKEKEVCHHLQKENDELRYRLEESEAKKDYLQNLIDKMDSPAAEEVKLVTERNLYKQFYEQLLERVIEK